MSFTEDKEQVAIDILKCKSLDELRESLQQNYKNLEGVVYGKGN